MLAVLNSAILSLGSWPEHATTPSSPKICIEVFLVQPNTQFRTRLTQLGLQYIGGVETTTSVWEPGKQPLPAPPRKPGRGATPNVCNAIQLISRLR